MSDCHVQPPSAAFSHARDTQGEAGTEDLGREVSALLKGGEIILLHGPLGAGKTCFVRGVCRGLQVTGEVVSPTYTLVNIYTGRLPVYHLDFYRVEPGQDLHDIGVPDLLDEIWQGQAVALVEWPGPMMTELGSGPYFELLASLGNEPAARRWHLRGVPTLPPDWRSVFVGKGKSSC